MDYHYYVVYQWRKGTESGFSNDCVDSNKEFDTKIGMDVLYYRLKDKYKYDELTIFNLIPLKG